MHKLHLRISEILFNVDNEHKKWNRNHENRMERRQHAACGVKEKCFKIQDENYFDD